MFLKKVYFLPLLFLLACDVHINKNFNVEDNSTVDNDLITVNGNIIIGENCLVKGTLSTVNGNIIIRRYTRVKATMQTVNGSIDIEQQCKIRGHVSDLTGSIEISDQCDITGNVTNVSGDIDLNNVVVNGNVTTNFGNISIAKRSNINGTIIIEENDEIPEKLRSVRVELSDSSVVEGGITNNNKVVKVTVFIQPGSIVNGDLIDVDIIKDKNNFGYE